VFIKTSRKYRAKDGQTKQLTLQDMPLRILQSTRARILEEAQIQAMQRSANDEMSEDKDAEEFEVYEDS